MKNLPSGFGIKQVMSALGRRPNGTPESGCKKPRAGLPRKEYVVDILLFAMVIASAVSLVVVSPGQAKQETLRALRDEGDFAYRSMTRSMNLDHRTQNRR
jgi:hypothetical protein